MSRRSFVVAISIFAVLVASVGTSVLLLVRYEPQHYTHAAVPPGPLSSQASHDALLEMTGMISAIQSEKEWYGHFEQEQINSYLSEGFVQSGLAKQFLPDGVSDPRVVFEPDRIRLAFRLRQGFLSTVISMDMKVWLAANEPNAVCVQLESFRAGVLPIAAHWLLERISEMGRMNGIDVSWYRHEGYPVALLRFQADQPRSTLVLQAIKIDKGSITIKGKSNDANNTRAELHPTEGFRLVNGN